MTFLFDNTITFADGKEVDGFGRLRVSNLITLFESMFQYDKDDTLWSEKIENGGSIIFLANEVAAQLSTTTVTGSKAIRQTFQRIRYQPGKPQLILMTGVLGPQKTGLRSRIGYFDDDNGLFFEQDASSAGVVLRSFTSGISVDTKIAQSSWNLDTLDGTGASGITLDLTKNQIFVIDFQWLGAGRIRYGFGIDGSIIYVHSIDNANVNTAAFMGTPALPCRVELENVGATASSSSIKSICTTVLSEGGGEDIGAARFASTGQTTVSIADTAFVPMISIRIDPTRPGADVIPTIFSILNTSNTFLEFKIFARATLTGASFTSATSNVEVDTSASALSGGLALTGGYLDRQTDVIANRFTTIIKLGTDIDGVTDIVTLAARTIAGTSNVLAAISWNEQD